MTETNPLVVPQRSTACRVLTPGGWLQGKLRMPRDAALHGYLNRLEPYFRLTDVVLPTRSTVHPFFALGRDSVLAVVPEEPAEQQDLVRGGGTVTHSTSWLLPGGVLLDALLDLQAGERVSDHLMHRQGFVRMHDCTFVFPHGGAALPGQFAYGAVALQSARAIGVTEVTDAPAN